MNSANGFSRSQRFGGCYSTKWIRVCVVVVSWICVVGCGVAVQAQQSGEWVIRRDVVVYGGTSSGVVSAVAAARQGKTVVLIEPTQFLGGLTTGGLGATDIGNKRAIGGISREFYRRVYTYYKNPDRWTQETRGDYFKGRTVNSQNEDSMWTFEPHVASRIFDEMLREQGLVVCEPHDPSEKLQLQSAPITLLLGERLDLTDGVKKAGARIESISLESGKRIEGTVFIDASYEGDLMAKSGVGFHVGRESNATYGETINGLQKAKTIHHQFVKPVDPYVVPGDRASGLLPNITAMPEGQDGDGDHRIQAYNYRMCTTDIAENRVAWPKPDNYDERNYELLLRNFEAGDMRVPWAPIWMPNRKTDVNNNFAFSTDYIGKNYAYPDGDYATRESIVRDHENYQKGLMWTLANHARVPEAIRKIFQENGLAKDEFIDNGHWPRQLYVREARRMVAAYVMTEKNCKRIEVVQDSVGMGAYNMDSHNTQRYVTEGGLARNEGDVQIPTKPYPISSRSIMPKQSECDNLLVPVCLSASHIAYGSIRMEPVFMVLGQSSAEIACLALDRQCAVQEVPYELLQARLLEAKQVLDFQ